MPRTVPVLLVALTVLAPGPAAAGLRPDDHAITATGQLVIEGSDIQVQGDVHGNGNVILSGTVRVLGAAEAGGQVALLGDARAARVVGGVRHTGVARIDFARWRRQATRVLTGDQRFTGPVLLQGTTYVAGSVTVDGPLGGSGVLVAEGDVVLTAWGAAGTLPFGDVSLLAGRQLVVRSSGGVLAGRLTGQQAVSITGNGLRLSGRIEGWDVFVRGSRITIIGAGGGVGLPPVVGQRPGTLRIDAPAPGELVRTGRILVVGQAPPGARVRLLLRHTESGREQQVETTAGADGRFSAFVDVPGGPGAYVLQARLVGPGLVLSLPVEVAIRVQDMP